MASMIFSECSTARLLPLRCHRSCPALSFSRRVSLPLTSSRLFLPSLSFQPRASSTSVSATIATESSAKVIDGKAVAKQIREEIGVEIARMKEAIGIVPGLAVILVGDRKDSATYVRNKKKACDAVGINSFEVHLPEDTTEQEVLNSISRFNEDPSVHGILVQLPLPSHMNEEKILNAVGIEKDVDGFHPLNIGRLAMRGREPLFVPCTPKGCIELLHRYGIQIKGKKAVVIGRSNIVGMPAALLLQREDATVTIVHSRTNNPEDITELEMIRQSLVYQETINHDAQIKQDYLVIKPVFDRFPDAFEDVQFDSFKHAYGIVASRAWESMKGQSLIPFADFLNHDGTSDSVVLCDVKDRSSEVIADRDYAPDEEIIIHLDIPYNDHLRGMKLDILQKHCLSKVKDANFSPSGASFVIKEVRSSRGKGKGIPQSLRAFARILCCTCSQELNDLVVEAAQHDGRLARRPLGNRTLEIRAHEILLSLINKLIEEYDVSIKSLHMLEPRNCRKFAIRQKMAQDLLAGEVRVLRSASAWLKNYCQSYPEQGKTS